MDVFWKFIGLLIIIASATFLGLASTWKKQKDRNWLAIAMGIAIGALTVLFLVELLPETINFSGNNYWWITGIIFGWYLNWIIDRKLPHFAKNHQKSCHQPECKCHCEKKTGFANLEHTATMTAISFGSHNLAEGLIFGALVATNFSAALILALAIILHNLPLSVAVALPEYFATNSRKSATKILFWATLPFIVTSIASFLVVQIQDLPSSWLSLITATTFGMLIYTTINELWPMAKKYGGVKLTVIGIIGGAVAMMLLSFWG